MARKPTLSPSRITTYLACPVRYRWTYVDERGRWYLRSRRQFSFGTTLHKVLQRFHDSSDSGVATVEDAVAAVEEHWIEAGYRSSQEMEEAMGEGKALIETYVQAKLARPSEAKVLYVEKSLSLDMGDFVLRGILDRVDEYPDGSLEIVDYKSQRKTVTPDDIAGSIAMACYQLLLQDKFPDRKISASITALQTGATATYAMPEEERVQFRNDLIALAREILNCDYENLEPITKPLCGYCEFIPLCRKHPEFSEPILEG